MKQFISSYMGEFDYTIDGIRYHQRVSASAYHRSVCNPGVFDREILPKVGTVTGEHGIFPPPSVMAEFVGYVAARWNSQTNSIETLGAPDVLPGARGNERVARAYANEMLRYDIQIAA